MMVNALKQLTDLPTEIITFSDDMDGLRKVPDNVPNQELLNKNLHKPLTQVPDPFEKFASFGEMTKIVPIDRGQRHGHDYAQCQEACHGHDHNRARGHKPSHGYGHYHGHGHGSYMTIAESWQWTWP